MVSQIAPVALYYVNEFGNGTAIFDNLVRAEFHFDPASAMEKLAGFQGQVWFPNLEDTLLVDKTGKLAHHLHGLLGNSPPRQPQQETTHLTASFLNWFLFGINVLARGEMARALEIQQLVHDNLLRMVRLIEAKTANWITPARSLEQEISTEAYQQYQKCTSKLDAQELWAAYNSMWTLSLSMLHNLSESYDTPLPNELIKNLSARLQEYSPPDSL